MRNWLYVEDFARAIHTVLESGRPGEAYNAGGPDETYNLDVVHRIIELTGADPAADRARARPPRPRPPLLAGLGEDPLRAGLGGGGALRARASSQTVQWYREHREWWEPIRSGEYREYYERQYGRALG